MVCVVGAGPGAGPRTLENGVPKFPRVGYSDSGADFANGAKTGVSLSGLYKMVDGFFCNF